MAKVIKFRQNFGREARGAGGHGASVELGSSRERAMRGRALSPQENARARARAISLLTRAAQLLSEIDGEERHVAWLVEDCRDLVLHTERGDLPSGSDNASSTVSLHN